VKAAACAELLAGCKQRDVAARYGLGRGTVARWALEMRGIDPRAGARRRKEAAEQDGEQGAEQNAEQDRPERKRRERRSGGSRPAIPRRLWPADWRDPEEAAEEFRRELRRLMTAMAAAPRAILERIEACDVERLDAERAEAVASLLRVATDSGARLLEAAAALLAQEQPAPVQPVAPDGAPSELELPTPPEAGGAGAG
jgi:transcriptional regulator with XRE-family HTH domain